MSQGYFSDTERSPKARVVEEINADVWRAIRAEIESRIENGSFGLSFPLRCSDGRGPTGTDGSDFYAAAYGHIPELKTEDRGATPPTLAILDYLQFCYRRVAKPIQRDYHSFFQHYHLTFDEPSGQHEFREQINLLLARNGLAFNLEENGDIVRLATPVLQAEMAAFKISTGDEHLNRFISDAVTKFLSSNPGVRLEALEKLWDAWERLKSLEPGDKKESSKVLLDKAAPEPVLRKLIEDDAVRQTFAGNNLMIRHSESGKEPITRSAVADYLFHELFALILFLLRATGRAS